MTVLPENPQLDCCGRFEIMSTKYFKQNQTVLVTPDLDISRNYCENLKEVSKTVPWFCGYPYPVLDLIGLVFITY